MSDTPLADKVRKAADDLSEDCRLAIHYVGRLYDLAQEISVFETAQAPKHPKGEL